LEWALIGGPGFVKSFITIASNARVSPWAIGWNTIQRELVRHDTHFRKGDYFDSEGADDAQRPHDGMALARMLAMMTYRTPASFTQKFGRREQQSSASASSRSKGTVSVSAGAPLYAVQSYLDYQGDKFEKRFDANCYIHLTEKMDAHDILRGRVVDLAAGPYAELEALREVLKDVPPALVVGVTSDYLFPVTEQQLLKDAIGDRASWALIDSIDGHDGFLTDSPQVATAVSQFLRERFPETYA
jgi:homoserine O-acetyltransferase